MVPPVILILKPVVVKGLKQLQSHPQRSVEPVRERRLCWMDGIAVE
ncbi:hypothetical protein [Paenibacillus popilliae]|nr:hypothetical protein [Paenibacillus popilliae]